MNVSVVGDGAIVGAAIAVNVGKKDALLHRPLALHPELWSTEGILTLVNRHIGRTIDPDTDHVVEAVG
jgi:hypothetical protein